MSITLVAVSGLAELLTWSAVQRIRHTNNDCEALLLYGSAGSVPKSLRRETKELATVFADWSEVLDLFDFDPMDHISMTAALSEFQFAEKITRLAVDRLGATEKALFDTFPSAQITFFDNGLASHIGNILVGNDIIERIDEAFFTLANYLPIPKEFGNANPMEITSSALVNAAKDILLNWHDEQIELLLKPGDSYFDLILGTSFHRTKKVTFEEERDIALSALQSCGGDTSRVIYKDHPRNHGRSLLTPADGVSVLKTAMPIELIAARFDVQRSFSLASTSLLTLKKMYGIEPIVLGREAFTPHYTSFPHVKMLHDLLSS